MRKKYEYAKFAQCYDDGRILPKEIVHETESEFQMGKFAEKHAMGSQKGRVENCRTKVFIDYKSIWNFGATSSDRFLFDDWTRNLNRKIVYISIFY